MSLFKLISTNLIKRVLHTGKSKGNTPRPTERSLRSLFGIFHHTSRRNLRLSRGLVGGLSLLVLSASSLVLLESQFKLGSHFSFISSALAAEKANFSLVSLEVKTLNNGESVLDIKFEDKIPSINHFMMASPPRVIIDFPQTENMSDNRVMKIRKGTIESAILIGNGSRLRVVLNLNQSGKFKTENITGGYRINLNSAARATNASVSALTSALSKTESSPNNASQIKDIDFRRTKDGRGRITIKLNNPDTVVDFHEQSGELIAEFINSQIDDQDERRLDVTDYATPVSTIDIFRNKTNVKLIVTPMGQYKHTVTQNNKEYVIEVAPLTKKEQQALKEDESGYSGETLSLNFQRIPVRAALQVIADFTGINIITSDSVDGDLSLRLNDVPWDQALDLILQSKGLSMRQKGNVIRIAPSAEIIEQERAEFAAQKEVVDLEPLATELIRVSYAKAEDIAALLKSIKTVDTNLPNNAFGSVSIQQLETEENNLLSSRGSVTVDNRTNSLLIQDTPSHIREVRELIAQLDIPVRQIQIETRIVEATDDFSRSLGARLGFTRITDGARLPGTSDNNSLGTVFGSGSIEATNSVRDDNVILYPDALSVNLPADSLGGNAASSYAYQLVKIGAGYLHLLDLEISALQAEGKGKIIANPKIITTDKHEAHIEQGQERVFVNSSLVGGGTTTKKAVLGLTVTPQITPDDQIILDVEITNDSFAGNSNNTLNTKQIKTQALLKNGETIVIGGIYQQDSGESTIKTPFLGDLPFIGHLFKKKTKRDNRTELLVFLTPRIIKPEF